MATDRPEHEIAAALIAAAAELNRLIEHARGVEMHIDLRVDSTTASEWRGTWTLTNASHVRIEIKSQYGPLPSLDESWP